MMIGPPMMEVGWIPDEGGRVFGPVLEDSQIAYAMLDGLHSQEGPDFGLFPTFSSEPLYRGIGFEGAEDFYESAASLKVGDTLEWGLASFSPSAFTASSFANTDSLSLIFWDSFSSISRMLLKDFFKSLI